MSEPPFDGKPCPMCPHVVRGFSAVVYNILNTTHRYEKDPERFRRKKLPAFMEVVESVRGPEVAHHFTVHPALVALRDEAIAITVKIKNSPAMTVVEAMNLFDRLYELESPVRDLSEAHFSDRRHSHGYE